MIQIIKQALGINQWRLLLIYFLLFLFYKSGSSQSIVITDDAAYTSGHASSVLDVKSTTKGLLIPRLTQAERNLISSPAGGLMIYQTDNSPGFYYYNGSSWGAITGTADGSETKVNSGASVNVTGTGTSGSPYVPNFRTQSVTQAQRIAISSPITGQIVWCSDCGAFGEMQLYNGSSWTTWCGSTPAPILPTVTTASVTSIAGTTATSGGNVTSDGGGTVTARGVCWNTSSNPTTSNSNTTDGTGTGSFTSSITGLSASTTYYVRAYATNGAGTSYGNELNFTTVPAITGTTPGSRCGTGTVSLSATASSGTINWYTASTGGTSLGTGTSYTTPSISSTTSYWVDATNSSGTSSPRTQIIATVNSIPTITGTTPGSRCGTGTVTLGATASAGSVNWFSAASGGSSLGTGTSYTTPSISATTIYYVDATSNGCTTASRSAVTATVNSIPTITGTTPASRCGTGTVTLGATASAGTINWYSASSGGSSLGSGTSFTTPSISITTTYWVDATSGGCTTASRSSVIATVNTYTPTLSTNTVSSITKNSAISGGNITTDGGSAVISRGICWSTSANPTLANNYAANGSGTGSYNVTMTGLSASTTYYVRAYATNCSGTYYGTQQSFTTLAAMSVGDSYGGGIVAYIFQSGDPGYVAGETHGLIAATSDIPYLTPWGCNGYTMGASGTALVTGYSNTAIIISMCYDLCAAYYCWYTYTSGYTDWYLPSRDELSKLYLNKSAIGGFSNAIYWSSSETNWAQACMQDFTTGTQYSTGSKASSYQTRQVRRF